MKKRILFPTGAILFLTGICFSGIEAEAQSISSNEIANLSHVQKQVLWSSNPSINITLENAPLEEALVAIAEKAKVGIYYDSHLVKQRVVVNIDAEEEKLSEVLHAVLAGTGLDVYTIGRNIFLKEKKVIQDSDDESEVVQESVEGQVVDAQTGEALPGVNILVVGTDTGTTTDVSGNFELTIPSLDSVLRFSFIGYQTQEIPLNGRNELNLELEPIAVAGDEVIVTALGIARETRSTGYSTATVSPDQFAVNRTGNFMNALQGQIAGVNIQSVSSGPGGSSRVRIRGQSGFGSNNDPLIVVDGMPISNMGNHSGLNNDGQVDGGDGLGSINPDIIESMTVLKGAAASALYGARAKDGVIIITTKRDAGGQGIGITYNSNIQMSSAIDDTDYQYEYGQGEGGLRPTDPFPVSGVWSFGEKIEPGMTHTLFDGLELPYEPQKNRISEFFRDAYTVNNSINLSTGGAQGGMNLSISQLDQESIVPNSDFKRYNIALGFTQGVTENLNVAGNINYSRELNNMPVQTNNQNLTVPTTIYTLANTMPLDVLRENTYDEEGNEIVYSRFRNRTNPYLSTDPNVRINNSQRDRIFGNISLRYNFTDWLYLQGRVGQDYFTRQTEANTPTGLAFLGPAPEGFFNGSYDENLTRFREINADFLLGAETQLTEQFGLSGTFGGNIMNRRSDSNTQEADDFVVRGLYSLGNSRENNSTYSYSERQVNSLYASMEFDYNNYLFLNLTARNDWFSTLDPEERSILYPSVTTSFVFTDVFRGLPGWLNQGILRAGYAEVGSDTDVSFAAGRLTYNTNSNLYPGINGSMRTLGSISGNSLPVAGLRPMRVKEYEIGLDLQLFQKVNIDFTYYNKRSIDQILNQSISTTTGFSTRPVNVGESENQGVELLVNLTPVETTDFLWNFTINGSYNKSEVVSVGDETDNIPVGAGDWQTASGTIRHVEGHPMAEIWVTGYLRDDQGRKVINQNNGLPMNSPTALNFGSAIPKWVGGISNSFRYKNLGFSFLIDFKLGHKLLSALEHNLYRHGLDPRTLPGRETGSIVVEGVTPEGGINEVPADVYALYGSYGSNREEFIHNAGFWKLRQVTFDYNLTSLVAGFLPVNEVVLSLVGNHLLVFKKWTKQHDPEQVSFTGDDNTGISGAALPMTRNIGFNLKVRI